nr:KGG domain-containing protein [Oligoflexus tunisiensis]
MPSNQKDQKGKGSSQRGFAGMDEEQQREISAKGGRAAHQSGNAHEFDSEEAREAGRKGGQASHQSSQSSRGQNKGNSSSNRNEEEEDEDEGSSSSPRGGRNR